MYEWDCQVISRVCCHPGGLFLGMGTLCFSVSLTYFFQIPQGKKVLISTLFKRSISPIKYCKAKLMIKFLLLRITCPNGEGKSYHGRHTEKLGQHNLG